MSILNAWSWSVFINDHDDVPVVVRFMEGLFDLWPIRF
jgi:hypothetical protein